MSVDPRPPSTESPAEEKNANLLELHELTSGYGDLKVLDGISLKFAEGAIEVVLGRNGVGKTTLLSTVSGIVPRWSGEVRFDGREIGGIPAHRRARERIALVQEGKRVFHRRTVMENLVLGTFPLRLSRSDRRARCEELLEKFPMLGSRTNKLAGTLSGGQQQMLAIAQALGSEPRLLLLDEPSAGLAPVIVSEVFDLVLQLRSEGMTIILVEQLAEQALEIADHLTVIDRGKVTVSGDPSQFSSLKDIEQAYFGGVESPGL